MNVRTEPNDLLAAQALHEARARKEAIAPISITHGIEGIERAYAVAAINTQRQLDAGRRIVGKKVGLTSKAVQKQLGVDQPDFGILFDDMEFLCGDEVPVSRLLQPKVEAEVAFVVGKPLTSEHLSWAEFLNSVAYALPALEIVDSAIAGWKITLVDTVADNASCGLYVLGDQPIALGSISLADIGMQTRCNGEVVSVGCGAACMGHPLRAAYWLAKTMVSRGTSLHAGELILSGALGPMTAIRVGDHIEADCGSLGPVSFRAV